MAASPDRHRPLPAHRSAPGSVRSGFHQSSGADFQEPYLRYLFGFLGITDVEIVRAEGLAVSPAQRTDGMTAAHGSIIAPLARAA